MAHAQIDRELRAEGRILRAISPFGSETVQRLTSPLSDLVLSQARLRRLHCEKTAIRRPDGSRMRTLVLHCGKGVGKTIGILWLHGGGYALGAPEMVGMSFARQLALHEDCVIVSPAYTLSAKKPFPAALNDAYLALLWMHENRERLGIDCASYAVGGESAGGGLTAAVCMWARERGFTHVGLQIPLYPMLDDRDTATNADNAAPVWDTASNRAAWNIYLDGLAGKPFVSPYAAPARQTVYTALPPAITVVGDAEPFYDETRTYIKNLRTAGVETALREFPGAYHAFDMLAPYAQMSREANRWLLEQVTRFADNELRRTHKGE